MERFNFNMIFMTDPIIDKKMFGIEYLNAEGNSRKVAYDIRDALSKSCNHVELFENIEQLTTNIPKYKDYVIFSTRYGVASPNSKALIPAICESSNINYIGANSYTHMLCNDKNLSKIYLKQFGLRTAPAVLIRDANDTRQMMAISFLRFPVVIKPNYGGGSNGITNESIQHTLEGAMQYIKLLQSYQRQPILVEEYVPGYEVEVIIFGNKNRILFTKEIQITIHEESYFTDQIYDLQTKKVDESASKMNYSNLISDEDKIAMSKLFQSFDKVEIMRIDCRVYNGHAYIIELSPDCYLGKDGGVYLAFQNKGVSFEEMFNLMIRNSLYPKTLTML